MDPSLIMKSSISWTVFSLPTSLASVLRTSNMTLVRRKVQLVVTGRCVNMVSQPGRRGIVSRKNNCVRESLCSYYDLLSLVVQGLLNISC